MKMLTCLKRTGVAAALFLCAGLSAQTELIRVGFEPAEGYPTQGPLSGYPVDGPSWKKWTGGHPQIANWNVVEGGQSARLYGTSTGELKVNAPANLQRIRLEGYVLANFKPSKDGRVDFGLIANGEDVRWVIAVSLNEDGKLYYRDAAGIKVAAGNLQIKDNVFYRIAIDADYATGRALIYANEVAAGRISELGESDLLVFGGSPEVGFNPQGGFSGRIGIAAIEGAEGFFDLITVTGFESSAKALWSPHPNVGGGQQDWSPHPRVGNDAAAAVEYGQKGTFRLPTEKVIQPVIGLCGGGRFYNTFTPLMKGSGATSNRFHYQWKEVETQKGVYDLPASAYDYMRNLQVEQMDLLHILAYYNPLYNKIEPKSMENFSWFKDQGPEFVEGFARYSGWMAKTFGSRGTGQIKYWEIWNEQNAGPADQYMVLLRESVKRIKEEDPEAFIVMGGVSRSDIQFLRECLEMGAAEIVDAIAFHPYREGAPEETFKPGNYGFEAGTVDNYADEVAIIRETVDKHTPAGKKPLELWITELGYWTVDARARYPKHLAVSHDVQAKYLLRSYLQNFALGVNRVYWYDLVGSFGITYGNKQPRPAYYAMANLASVMPQGQNVRVLGWEVKTTPRVDDLHAYAFQTDPKTILLFLWKGGPAKDAASRFDEWDKVSITIPRLLAKTPVQVEGVDVFSDIAFSVKAEASGAGETVIDGVPLWDSPVMLKLQVSPEN